MKTIALKLKQFFRKLFGMATFEDKENTLKENAKTFIDGMISTLTYLKDNKEISNNNSYARIKNNYYYSSNKIISNYNKAVLVFEIGGKKILITQNIDAFNRNIEFKTHECKDDLNAFNIEKERYIEIEPLIMNISEGSKSLNGKFCDDLEQSFLDELIFYFKPSMSRFGVS